MQKKFTRLFETETNISRNYSQLALVPEEYDDLNILTEATIYATICFITKHALPLTYMQQF